MNWNKPYCLSMLLIVCYSILLTFIYLIFLCRYIWKIDSKNMTSQRIRIRTDIFRSQELALLEEWPDGIPLNLILPTPVPSIQNDMFKPYDEPDVICLGNVKNWDYNDNITVGPRIIKNGVLGLIPESTICCYETDPSEYWDLSQKSILWTLDLIQEPQILSSTIWW